MKIEIEVPESLIIDAAVKSWRIEFAPPQYSNSEGGAGFEQVRLLVRGCISEIDMHDICLKALQQFTPVVVRDVVQKELAEAVRRESKAQLKAGPAKLGDELPLK